MSLLSQITTEAPSQPARVYLYASEKWGKTSWAAHAPKPLFLMTQGETGLLDLISCGQVRPTAHLPKDFQSWPDLLNAVRAVEREPHDYQTLVIDTANGAERLLSDHILDVEFKGQQTGKGGYNSYAAGDLACIPHWQGFLRQLDAVRVRRKMSIILLAHSKVKSVNNPEGDDYDQLRPEGLDKLWPLTHKWASIIAAGSYKVFVKNDKASGGRDRVIRLRSSAAVVAGNRYGLPDEIPCGATPAAAWTAFANAMKTARPQKPVESTPPVNATTSPPVTPPTPDDSDRRNRALARIEQCERNGVIPESVLEQMAHEIIRSFDPHGGKLPPRKSLGVEELELLACFCEDEAERTASTGQPQQQSFANNQQLPD